MPVDYSVKVTCDECGEEYPDDAGVELGTEGGGLTLDFDGIRSNDWHVSDDGDEVLCPECKPDEDVL